MRSLIPVKTGGFVKVINADQITQVVHAADPHTIDLHKSSINIGIGNHTRKKPAPVIKGAGEGGINFSEAGVFGG
jgi:hypothetical protein